MTVSHLILLRMTENQYNTAIHQNIREFNQQCAQQRTQPTTTSHTKNQKRVHNYIIDTSIILG